MNTFTVSRRTFLKGTGALIISFGLLGGERRLATAAPQPQVPPVPGAPANLLSSWLAIADDNTVTVFVGNVELGTGVETALAQIAAEELDVAMAQVTVVQGDSARTVNVGPTVGSLTIARNGSRLRQAAAEGRAILLRLGAERLGAPVEQLRVRDGVVEVAGDPARRVTYGELVAGRELAVTLTGEATPKDPAAYHVVGQSIPRLDIPGKLTGQFTYIHDLRLPGMLHGRVVRPAPQSGARLVAVDEASVRGLPGVVRVVVEGDFVGVIAEREEQAMRAARELRVTWSAPAGLPPQERLYALLRETPSDTRVLDDTGDVGGALEGAARTLSATYEFPFQSHGMMGPSCAVAEVRDGRATIWSGTQDAHGLAAQLAARLDLPPENVRVLYVEGAGCYGRLFYDDAALDAALLSRAVGRPVRVQYSRADEHGWEFYGPPMVFDLRGGLDRQGNVVAWDYEAWTPMHRGHLELLGGLTGGEWAVPVDPRPGDHTPNFYTFANRRLTLHVKYAQPLRYLNLRSLGGLASAFAAESFVDELAAAAEADPVAFRLRYLDEPRAIAVLQATAERFGWDPRPSPQRGAGTADPAVGRGIALGVYGVLPQQFGRTWVAAAAEVAVDPRSGEIRVPRIVVAHDCGLIINPDGVRSQVEGNVLQALSRTLHEEITFDQHQVTSLDWATYPILRFSEVPAVEVVLIDRPDVPAHGAGESATVPVAAAIANAVFDATGARLRRVPFTPERVQAALRQRAG